jgi:hypothetical protein
MTNHDERIELSDDTKRGRFFDDQIRAVRAMAATQSMVCPHCHERRPTVLRTGPQGVEVVCEECAR